MRRAWIIPVCLCLQIAACTKKKPAETPATSSEGAAPIPQDTIHAKFPLSAQATGEIRNAWQPTPREQAQLKVFEAEATEYAALKNQLDKGKALFQLHCATCHGTEGRSGGPAADSLPVAPTNFHEWPIKFGMKPAELALTITTGRNEGVMPPFGAVLKKDELWSVVWLVASWMEARPNKP